MGFWTKKPGKFQSKQDEINKIKQKELLMENLGYTYDKKSGKWIDSSGNEYGSNDSNDYPDNWDFETY